MIKLTTPGSLADRYVNLDGLCFGPMGSQTPVSSITYRHASDHIMQLGTPLYGEKSVDHDTTEADLVMYETGGFVTEPALGYPDRIRMTYQSGSGTATAVFDLGFAWFGRVAQSSAGTTYEWYALETFGNDTLTVYQVTANKSTATTNAFRTTKIEYKVSYVNDSNCTRIKTTWGFNNTTSNVNALKGNWSIPHSWGEIVSLVNGTVLSTGTSSQPYLLTVRKRIASPTANFAVLRDKVDEVRRKLYYATPSRIPSDFGTLAAEASQNFHGIHVNMIAFVRDLREPLNTWFKLKDFFKSSTMASNYLAIKYGLAPTISDCQKIVASFRRLESELDRFGFQLLYATDVVTEDVEGISMSWLRHIKLAINNEDSAIVDFIDAAERTGFFPSFENLWDLVPYSFVVDWFIGIGDFLQSVDSTLRLGRWNIPYTTMSDKMVRSYTIAPTFDAPISGTVSLVRYTRWTADHCPEPPLSLSPTFTASDHWLEASALMIQRLK